MFWLLLNYATRSSILLSHVTHQLTVPMAKAIANDWFFVFVKDLSVIFLRQVLFCPFLHPVFMKLQVLSSLIFVHLFFSWALILLGIYFSCLHLCSSIGSCSCFLYFGLSWLFLCAFPVSVWFLFIGHGQFSAQILRNLLYTFMPRNKNKRRQQISISVKCKTRWGYIYRKFNKNNDLFLGLGVQMNEWKCIYPTFF